MAAGIAGATLLAGAWLFVRQQEGPRHERQPQLAAYFGKDGVVEIDDDGGITIGFGGDGEPDGC